MQANVVDLIDEGGRIAGVRATTPDGPLEVRAAPDGRLRRTQVDGARQGGA